MIYIIEVTLKPEFIDHHGEHIRHDGTALGIKRLPKVRFYQLYKLEGEIISQEIKIIAEKLLHDPITENFRIISSGEKNFKDEFNSIEVWLKPGVTDTVAESVSKAVKDLSILEKLVINTGQKYVFEGKAETSVLKQIAEKLLVNSLVQRYTLNKGK